METSSEIRREAVDAMSELLSFCIATASEEHIAALRAFVGRRLAEAEPGSIRWLVLQGAIAEVDLRATEFAPRGFA